MLGSGSGTIRTVWLCDPNMEAEEEAEEGRYLGWVAILAELMSFRLQNQNCGVIEEDTGHQLLAPHACVCICPHAHMNMPIYTTYIHI